MIVRSHERVAERFGQRFLNDPATVLPVKLPDTRSRRGGQARPRRSNLSAAACPAVGVVH